MCNTLAKGSLKDEKYAFSDEEHYQQLKSLLSTKHFSSYKEWEQSGESLGANVPLEDIVVGFSADAKSDSGKFQEELNTFLSSDYDEARDRMKSIKQDATFNSEMLDLLKVCVNNTSRQMPGTYLEVIANSATDFDVIVHVTRPEGVPSLPVEIRNILPHAGITMNCTRQGPNQTTVPISVGDSIPGGDLTMECRKNAEDEANLMVDTTMGPSSTVKLPKAFHDTGPGLPRQKTITARWSDEHLEGPYGGFDCGCLSVAGGDDPNRPILNRCGKTVIINAMLDPVSPPAMPPWAPMIGRKFAQVTLDDGDQVTFPHKRSEGLVVGVLGCSGSSSQQSRLWCRVEISTLHAHGITLPNGQPAMYPSACPIGEGPTTKGVPCKCAMAGQFLDGTSEDPPMGGPTQGSVQPPSPSVSGARPH